MAENDQQQERTEQPTARRLEEARQKGQVPRSRELNMAAVLIAAAVILFATRAQLSGQTTYMLRDALTISPAMLLDPDSITGAFAATGLAAIEAFLPLLGGLLVAAIFGGVAIGGWAPSGHPLKPDLNKLNPIKGLKRVFGLRGLVEVGKSLAKAVVVAGVGLGYMTLSSDGLFRLSVAPLHVALGDATTLIATTFLICSLSLILIALVDVPYQIWQHRKQLRMTLKEVKDELKETDGRPEVKSRIRQLQQEAAGKRMLEDVPLADVVITNPTHFAVALRYADGEMSAPTVLAKGVDQMAGRIRGIAEEHDVPLFEAPYLARALYWTTAIGAEIPAQLYLAVAQVLTYIFGLRTAHEHGAPWPERPSIEVDEKLAQRPVPGHSQNDTGNSR
ncbi:MAG: flagellar biosynthesis protein FlhB [Gammaproteobacteria bacterium]